jgi:hypothetical protein
MATQTNHQLETAHPIHEVFFEMKLLFASKKVK